MSGTEVTVQRPQRWDVPFGERMTPDDVQRLLRIEPFAAMDSGRFPKNCSLPDILLNDSRIQTYDAGDLVVREGDYGASAFLVLRGDVHAFSESLPAGLLGRRQARKRSWLRPLAQLVHPSPFPEVRRFGSHHEVATVGQRGAGEQTRIFLQDLPRMLDAHQGTTLHAGEIFGEVSAMARSPRTATVVAKSPVALLEIRWQGLRELMRRSPELKQHVERLYRKTSLEAHLRESLLLSRVSAEHLAEITGATRFESYGDFEWHGEFRAVQDAQPAARLEIEPVIAGEGELADSLVLVRSGFARLSRRHGSGHQTVAYLGKGQVFGLEEVTYAWQHDQDCAWRYSLRALGYVDILRIPRATVEQHVLPTLGRRQLQQLMRFPTSFGGASTAAQASGAGVGNSGEAPEHGIDTGLLEFIVENRFMNGSQTMLIDLERCTRCDDCVQACAATHENNPRFARDGLRYGQYLFAHACMHCVDPVCMIGCPTGAIGRDEQTGNVVINDHTCIGCATCANSCPYDNIRMVEIRNPAGQFLVDEQTRQPIAKATKCDLCTDQLGGPACQRACPHDALIRTNMDDLPRLARWLQR